MLDNKGLTSALATLAVAALLATGCADETTMGALNGTTEYETPSAGGGTTTPGPGPVTTTKPSPATTSQPTEDPVCGDTSDWGTAQQEDMRSPVGSEIYNVSVGRHQSCDRVRFDVNTPGAVGWTVRYVPELTSDPQGDHIPVSGAAVLQVTIQAPDFGSAITGHQPGRPSWQVGQVIVQRDRWPALVGVTFAGSFENVATFGIGVGGRERPFRVWTQQYGDSVRYIVVDIAN
jgi:hypothetical protein